MSQVALVTGAAQGLGYVIVKVLAAAGFKVGGSDVNQAAVTQAVLELDPSGDNITALTLDVLQKDNFSQNSIGHDFNLFFDE